MDHGEDDEDQAPGAAGARGGVEQQGPGAESEKKRRRRAGVKPRDGEDPPPPAPKRDGLSKVRMDPAAAAACLARDTSGLWARLLRGDASVEEMEQALAATEGASSDDGWWHFVAACTLGLVGSQLPFAVVDLLDLCLRAGVVPFGGLLARICIVRHAAPEAADLLSLTRAIFRRLLARGARPDCGASVADRDSGLRGLLLAPRRKQGTTAGALRALREQTDEIALLLAQGCKNISSLPQGEILTKKARRNSHQTSNLPNPSCHLCSISPGHLVASTNWTNRRCRRRRHRRHCLMQQMRSTLDTVARRPARLTAGSRALPDSPQSWR